MAGKDISEQKTGYHAFLRNINDKLTSAIDPLGNFLVDIFHYGALFAIGAVTVWAAFNEFLVIAVKPHATVEDLLLLFLYLEIGAMVGIYFRTNRMPVRFLVYVDFTYKMAFAFLFWNNIVL